MEETYITATQDILKAFLFSLQSRNVNEMKNDAVRKKKHAYKKRFVFTKKVFVFTKKVFVFTKKYLFLQKKTFLYIYVPCHMMPYH